MPQKRTIHWPPWLARLLILLVFTLNLQAAALFVLFPERFLAPFELSGVPGRAAIQGVGILFLMWQVPYGFALYNPVKHRSALLMANLMQLIGLVGESLLLISIPQAHARLATSIRRFVIFDGGGLLLLLAALVIVRVKPTRAASSPKDDREP